MDKPLAGGGCVERSKAICDVRALRCRLEPRRLTFPFAQFRRTDYALPRELCQASHSREESARNDSLVLSLPLLSLSLPLPSMLNPPPPPIPIPLPQTHIPFDYWSDRYACARAHTHAHTRTHQKSNASRATMSTLEAREATVGCRVRSSQSRAVGGRSIVGACVSA